MTREQRKLLQAAKTYVEAASNLNDVWRDVDLDLPGVGSVDYPKYLPDFDDHVDDLIVWLKELKVDLIER